MASVIDDPNGRRRIQFVAQDGSRKTIRLGRIDRKGADAICRHVEFLLSCQMSGQPLPRETASWLAGIGADLRDKLARAGLVEGSALVPTLGEFLHEYLANRETELKSNTMLVMKSAACWLIRALGANVRLNKVTPTDSDKVRSVYMQGRARATADKVTRFAKEFFTQACKRRLIESNPFAHITGLAVVGNAARRVFIPEADIRKVLDAIPCPQFRLIVALARYGGLRVPSEILNLTWADVNWEHSRLIVRASKTEHQTHGGVRVVPIFKELRPYLEDAWNLAQEGQVHVITRYSDPKQNLRTQFNRWVLEAGLEPCGKPFQNMRASRSTELADQFPSHVCAKWLGHSERIADEFYRSVTDEHYTRATGGAFSGTQAAQKAAQQTTKPDCKELKSQTESTGIQAELHHPATIRDSVNIGTLGRVGVEPTNIRLST